MIAPQIARFVRRWMYSGTIWAMIPLAAWGGMPIAQCACDFCQCGSKCDHILHGNGTGANGSSLPTKNSCGTDGAIDRCCSDGQRRCCCEAGVACGGQVANDAARKPVGNGFGIAGAPSCRMTVTTVPAVRAQLVVMCDYHLATLQLDDSQPFAKPVKPFDLRDPLDTGPPSDLVVTLRRLVI